jgi:hypothetical protein
MGGIVACGWATFRSLSLSLELAGLRHDRGAKSRTDRCLSPLVKQCGTFEYEAGEGIGRIGLQRASQSWRTAATTP